MSDPSLSVLRELLQSSPFNQLVPMQIEGADRQASTLILRVAFSPQFAAQAQGGSTHGGVIAAALDVAGTFLVMLLTDRFASTLNLHVDYLRPASGGLITTASMLRLGKSAAVVDVVAADAAGEAFAVARGNWMISNRALPRA